jgi:fatty-acyl-CoA synthase
MTPKPKPATLIQAVEALADDRARGFVFVQPDGTERFCSFHEIHAESVRRGAHFVARGLRKGDRLAMVIPEPDEFVLSFLGAMFAGVVPVPIHSQVSARNVDAYADSLAHILRAADAAGMVTSPSIRPLVEPGLARHTGAGARGPARALMSTGELATTAPGPLRVAVDPQDLALLQFTSGSTSRPKGVMVSHANLAANARAFMLDGLEADDRIDKGVTWLPLFHDMGLIGFVVGPLFTNVPCVFLPSGRFVRSPLVWLETIHRHRGTITYAPNFAYALVAKRLKERDLAGLDLSCLRVVGCGAEPIQAQSLRDFAAKLAPTGFDARTLTPSYGMAEATLAVTLTPHRHGLGTDSVEVAGTRGAPQEIVDCGVPLPGSQVAVIDETGSRLPDRQVGEIVVRGPSVSAGYYQEPELTRRTFRPIAGSDEVWLHTGDLGYLVDGHLFVCGRIKDMIVIRGRNYYPQDIEWVVGDLPGIRQGNVVAFGVNVDGSGQIANGGEEQLVVCAEGASVHAASLANAIAASLAATFALAAYRIQIVPSGTLPRTSSGKLQRAKARAMFIDGALPNVPTGASRESCEGTAVAE